MIKLNKVTLPLNKYIIICGLSKKFFCLDDVQFVLNNNYKKLNIKEEELIELNFLEIESDKIRPLYTYKKILDLDQNILDECLNIIDEYYSYCKILEIFNRFKNIEDELVNLWSDMDYPESLRHLIYYMPKEQDLSINKLYSDILKYLYLQKERVISFVNKYYGPDTFIIMEETIDVMKKKEVKKMIYRLLYPSHRQYIEDYFKILLETHKAWTDLEYKHPFWDSLCYNFLDPFYKAIRITKKKTLGVVAYDKQEADELNDFEAFLRCAIEAEMPDEYYLNHPNWFKLLEWAESLLAQMHTNDKKYNFKEELSYFENYYSYTEPSRIDEWQKMVLKKTNREEPNNS